MKRSLLALVVILTFTVTNSAQADIVLSKVFGDHMVLQQEQPIRLFGAGSPGEKVTAELAGKTATATTGKDGRFRVELPAMKADGKAHTLTVCGKNRITLKDILLGEVWICSGQSNMEWTVGGTLN
ncbi:MAG: 9-O-acetylesterase, partial [Planctomycetaceae bacterium]|nr:9-O-acetylesterase [Planctomycetaceae bacterium]